MKPPPASRRPRLGPLDVVLLGVVAAALAWLAWRVAVAGTYRWNWAPVWQFLVRWDEASASYVPNIILHGLFNTIRLTVFGMVLATALGFAIGLMRVARDPALRLLARLYVELMRNTPPLVIIFVIYFFVSSQIVPLLGLEAAVAALPPGTRAALSFLFGEPRLLENFVAGLLCLALFEAAYIAEIVRAGIESIDKGQWESAAALGLKRRTVLRRVILPQAVARTVPPLCNQFISLVKDSSIVSLVSIQELTFMASEVAVSSRRVFELWLVAAAIYFAVCFGLSLIFARIERRLRRGRA